MLSADVMLALCTRYGLGEPLTPPLRISGGLIHRLYRLTTTTGAYAVKLLNPEIMAYESSRQRFRRSEHVASAFASAGFPAVRALEAPGGTIQDFADTTSIVYPWHEGEVLSKSAASPDQAYQIGAILGRVHALDLRLPGEGLSSLPSPEPMDKEPWKILVRRGHEQGVEWAPAIEAALPELFAWNRDRIAADAILPQTLVLSHCDLDQKNVIWQGLSTPYLIDWESAGRTRPGAELVGAALDWSGQNAGPPDRAAFTAVIAGYRQEKEFDAGNALLWMRSRLAGWLDWLGASMQRSLGSKTTGSEEKALGIRETRETLAAMYALADGMDEWSKWCD